MRRLDEMKKRVAQVAKQFPECTDADLPEGIKRLQEVTAGIVAAYDEAKRYKQLNESGEVFRDVSQRSLLCVRLSTPRNWMLLSMFDVNAEMLGRVCLDKKTVGELARLLRQLEEEEMIG